MPEWLLPLFPLKVVLYPGTVLPLHIFEERYKQMIAECLDGNSEFGVLLVHDNSVQNVGCTAIVTEIVKTYDDGRMDIVAHGRRRFEIALLDSELPYFRGEPSFFEDEGEPLALHDLRRQTAVDLYVTVRETLRLDNPEDPPHITDELLSYRIASKLPLDLEFKQSLLPIRSEEERLTRVVEYLEKVTIRLAVAKKARASAGANGKAH
jgi:Lon protease-like protein